MLGMKITKIEKKKRLYLVEFDQADKLYVTEDTIVRFMLTKGMDITEQELAEISDFAQFSYGKNLALYHISFKQRTRKEVESYLIQHEVDSERIPAILQQLEEENWINDTRYAQQVIEQNLSSGDKGPYILSQKLGQKGIAKSIIASSIEKVDFSKVIERVSQKLYKKYQGKLPSQALKNKMVQSMVNKGFSISQATEAFQALDIEKDDQLEEELIYKELEKQHRKYSRKYDGYELQQRLTQALARKGFSYDDIQSALREYF